MKKPLVFISLLFYANFVFTQTPSATLSIPYVDVADIAIDENIHISIVVDDITCLVDAFQFMLSFNEDIISWDGTIPPDIGQGVAYIHPNLTPLMGPDWLWNNVAIGQIAFSWAEPTFYNPIEISPGETLITLVYTYHGGLAPGQSSPIEFMESTGIAIVPPENLTLIDGLIYNGLVSVDEPIKDHISIWSKNSKVYLQMPENNYNILMINLQGQIVKQGILNKGINEIWVPVRNTCLIVKIERGESSFSKKVFVR